MIYNSYYELTREPPDDGRMSPPPNDGPSGVANNISLITSSGGLAGTELALVIPCFDADGSQFYLATFDTTDYNTEDACEIWFRQEEIIEGREITVSRVRIIYKDLGICKLKCTLETTQQTVTQEITIGTANYKGKTYTAYFDIVITGERPQIKLSKEANSGPLNLISVTMITGVEMAEQM
jgi:hypothetical protein